MRLDTN